DRLGIEIVFKEENVILKFGEDRFDAAFGLGGRLIKILVATTRFAKLLAALIAERRGADGGILLLPFSEEVVGNLVHLTDALFQRFRLGGGAVVVALEAAIHFFQFAALEASQLL